MSDADPTPSATEALAAAARKSAIAAVAPGETPSGSALLTAMGGVRGLIESILPGFSFLVVYTITAQLLPSVIIPVIVAGLFVLVRIITKTPYTSAVAGMLGIAISAGLALLTGRAADNFVPGFLINAVCLLVLLLSIAVRWPLIGVIAALLTGEGSGWRSDRAKARVALIATLMWCALFVLRLGVGLPLYFADNTQALAATKLILGVPLYAAMLWVTWLLVRTVYARPQPE